MTGFITVDEAQQYLGNAKADPDLLKIMINGVTRSIKTWCGWEIESTIYQQFYDVKPESDIINLRHMPIISISGVSDNGTALTVGTDYTADTRLAIIKYKEVNFNSTPRNLSQLGGYFTPGKDMFFANYTAGYAEIPDDIKLVTMKEVFKEFNERGGNIKDFKSATLEYTRPDMVMGLMPESHAVLTNYRQIM